jgi:hypothetical protein
MIDNQQYTRVKHHSRVGRKLLGNSSALAKTSKSNSQLRRISLTSVDDCVNNLFMLRMRDDGMVYIIYLRHTSGRLSINLRKKVRILT